VNGFRGSTYRDYFLRWLLSVYTKWTGVQNTTK